MLEIFVDGLEKASRQFSSRTYAKRLMLAFEQGEVSLTALRKQYSKIFSDSRSKERGFFIGRWSHKSGLLFSSFEDASLEKTILQDLDHTNHSRSFVAFQKEVFLATKVEIQGNDGDIVGFDIVAFNITNELKRVLNTNENNITHDIVFVKNDGRYSTVLGTANLSYLNALPLISSGEKKILSFDDFDLAVSAIDHSKFILLSRYNLQDRINAATDYTLEYLPAICIVFFGLLLALLVFVIPLLRKVSHIDELNRTRESFFSATSHDMRTPLNGLMGCVELLKDEVTTPNGAKLLKIIDNSSKFVLKIIDDLLDYSKISAGSMNINLVAISTEPYFKKILDSFCPMAETKRILLQLQISESVPPAFEADPTKMEQVLGNLLGNALKFTNSGRVVMRVDASAENESYDRICIKVQDTGVGLTKTQVKEIFRPYVQVGEGAKNQSGGTGLGLSIAKELVGLHDEGEISVDSRLGKGSVFNVSFLSRRVEVHDRELQPKAISPRKFKVLVVEDDSTNRFVLKKFLQKLGHEADFADNGKEGVDKALINKYDLIFMDYKMPVMDGDQATKQIISSLKYERPMIVALSASTMYEDRKALADAGVDRYLSKPMHIEDIQQVFVALETSL